MESGTEQGPLGPIHVALGQRGNGTVMIGDTDISRAVRRVTIFGDPSTRSTHVLVSLIGLAEGTFISARGGQAFADIPHETCAALIALGWTPPWAGGHDDLDEEVPGGVVD